jgi:K+-transporting ATPase ATPase C chain
MKNLITAVRISLILCLLCGLLYPLAMTGLAQLLFPWQAQGSMVQFHGKPAGSELLGQEFTDRRFFHGRVSAVNYNTYLRTDTIPDQTGKKVYNGVSSGSANLAPSNPALIARVKNDLAEFLEAHPDIKKEQIPTDLLTSSGSGLDPHISPAAARIQIPAITAASGINSAVLEKIVSRATAERQFGVFGEPRVNVLKANLAIARLLNL